MRTPVLTRAVLAGALLLTVTVAVPAPAEAGRRDHQRQERILYWQYDADYSHSGMVTIRPDGSHRTVLDAGAPEGAYDYSPHWDATGRNITFFRALPGSGGSEGSSDLWTMRADGSHARQITHLGDVENPISSPDGQLIAFERDVSVGTGSEQDIWLVRTDGTHLRNLTQTPDRTDIWPRWTNHGDQLAYSTTAAAGTGYDLVLQDVRTRVVTPLASDPAANEIIATFSPNDRTVAYRSSADGNRGIYTDRVGGNHQPRLIVPGGAYADWAPNGRRIAVIGSDDEGSTLVTVRPDGTRSRLLVKAAELLFEPDWSPTR